ncbi:GPH family glycoside/pentoside/hexuronide:cation symporter [Litoreibacter ponti]|uniref:GPH family glycoside/pentoside/hexuronide:cation symporter n=1 Tax=Litoreibacter ponti TaxID=1510457 RepID=A0A2T6BNM3_9RHOB|nr:MFS transporter [Litoreibacter ponti]PTX57646.1 GPH family glycoside/pentoside/hexuronide:cation symporter [Litoreibacter ponti]
MTSAALPKMGDRLGAYALFAAVLSGAGLPIYIYAPKFYADTYGVSLATLGTVLFVLRLLDVVQDPVLGWVSERLGAARKFAVSAGALILALSMLGLFGITPPISPVWWFGLMITGLFSAFSFLTINFYAQGITKARDLGDAHTRVAAWRETGALLGVCVAAVTPTLLEGVISAPFAAFAAGFAGVTIIAASLMAPEWPGEVEQEPTAIGAILKDKVARRLLLLALVNATPLAVSSTLFLFYVESRLGAPGWEGPLLVLFFLAAAASAPLWARGADRWGEKPMLLSAMVMAIAAFGCVMFLGAGDVWIFAAICVASGATIGADLTLLPALFARRMAAISPNGGQGFGLWSLVSKFTLAFAAAILLPVLEAQGFQSGAAENPADALTTLTILYALVPCALKLVAIGLLLATPLKE